MPEVPGRTGERVVLVALDFFLEGKGEGMLGRLVGGLCENEGR